MNRNRVESQAGRVTGKRRQRKTGVRIVVVCKKMAPKRGVALLGGVILLEKYGLVRGSKSLWEMV